MQEKIDDKYLGKLAQIMELRSLTKISFKTSDGEILLERQPSLMASPVHYAPTHHAVQHNAPVAPTPTEKTEEQSAPVKSGDKVTSPVVGTVYLSPKPGEPNYITIGDKVTDGQVLMIVEAMKVMNSIVAPRAGTIVDILVENEDPVEFGQALVIIQ